MDVRLFGQRLEVDLLRRKLRKTQEQLKGLEFSHKEMEVECYKTKRDSLSTGGHPQRPQRCVETGKSQPFEGRAGC